MAARQERAARVFLRLRKKRQIDESARRRFAADARRYPRKAGKVVFYAAQGVDIKLWKTLWKL